MGVLLLLEGLYWMRMGKKKKEREKITLGYSNLEGVGGDNYDTKRGNFPATNGRARYQQMYSSGRKAVIVLSEVWEIMRASEVK